MNSINILNKIFRSSKEVIFDDSSKFVIISDCHRGDGGFADSFYKNENNYYAALKYYYKQSFIYIELGDGDELWENTSFHKIVKAHSDVFSLLSKFYREGRLYFIYGNHDIVKKNSKFVEKNLYEYFDENKNIYYPLFPNIKIREGLILKYKDEGIKILLIHGHQVDFFNSKIWRTSRFLVKYLWKPLEIIGINDPTSAAKNYKKKEMIDRKLIKWVKKEKNPLITGHTHRPIFPNIKENPYFNDGSCIHPRCITCIEINQGNITLVRWCVKTKEEGILYIAREEILPPRKIKDLLIL